MTKLFPNINLKTDITVFHECPELARGIEKMEDDYATNHIAVKKKKTFFRFNSLRYK